MTAIIIFHSLKNKMKINLTTNSKSTSHMQIQWFSAYDESISIFTCVGSTHRTSIKYIMLTIIDENDKFSCDVIHGKYLYSLADIQE